VADAPAPIMMTTTSPDANPVGAVTVMFVLLASATVEVERTAIAMLPP
jgi:hypothetical protein